jgi:hypothetical protein
MSGVCFEKLDARWHDFAELTLKGIPVERHAICHAAFLVGAATLCNLLSTRPNGMTIEEIEEFFADVETACSREAAQYRRRTSNRHDRPAGAAAPQAPVRATFKPPKDDAPAA